MSCFNPRYKGDYFSSALLISHPDPPNDAQDDTSHYQTSHSNLSSSMSNCLSKDLIRRLDSISPLEKRMKGRMIQCKSKESFSTLNQNAEAEFQLIEFDNEAYTPFGGIKHISEGSYFNISQAKAKNKKKKDKAKKNSKAISEEYITEMFGRRGWICEKCQNFNYESRTKCNRCKIPKAPKKIAKSKPLTIKSINSGYSPHQFPLLDWTCSNCFNLNYSFRQTCNRCQVVNPQHA